MKDYYLQMALVHDKVATGCWGYREAVSYINTSDIPNGKAKKLLNDICELVIENRKTNR
jgi:hypothetical protein